MIKEALDYIRVKAAMACRYMALPLGSLWLETHETVLLEASRDVIIPVTVVADLLTLTEMEKLGVCQRILHTDHRQELPDLELPQVSDILQSLGIPESELYYTVKVYLNLERLRDCRLKQDLSPAARALCSTWTMDICLSHPEWKKVFYA